MRVQVTYLEDGEMAIITRGAETGELQYTIKTVDNVQLCREVQQLELSLQEIQKGSHKVGQRARERSAHERAACTREVPCCCTLC